MDDGTLAWTFSCNAGIHSSPTVYGEFVFFGSDDGRFYAVNKSTGNAAWSFAPSFTVDDDLYNFITTPIISDPIMGNGTVFIGANGTIYALNAQTYESNINEQELDDPLENNQEDQLEGTDDEEDEESSFTLTLPTILGLIILSIVVIIIFFWIRKRN